MQNCHQVNPLLTVDNMQTFMQSAFTQSFRALQVVGQSRRCIISELRYAAKYLRLRLCLWQGLRNFEGSK